MRSIPTDLPILQDGAPVFRGPGRAVSALSPRKGFFYASSGRVSATVGRNEAPDRI